ncbi:unnamed protein product [Oppiella nova]|uniref:Inositol-1-monophosphatase n=1 Tax=Oppiella nova TaxID=334625 RepID=A0A7R9MJ40_9ACAR|nr:unnamed protein product [Oppiella nova]CAG2177352.1 unnamed protein product [Oppiella nova]
MDKDELFLCEQLAIRVAIEAGAMIKTASGRHKEVTQKDSIVDLVTETDKSVESYIFSEFRRHFPKHRFIGEESRGKDERGLTPEPTWIIDPIDGTMNFIHNFPYTCVSIGLTVDREPVIGVVYNPFLDKLYTARKGLGAKCNGAPIHVRQNCQSLSDALMIGDPNPAKRDRDHQRAALQNLEAIVKSCKSVRCMGTAALQLCYVAEGCCDGNWGYGIHVWDIVAAGLIVQEAGGVVLDPSGGPIDWMNRRYLVACSQVIGQQISQTLRVHLDFGKD